LEQEIITVLIVHQETVKKRAFFLLF